MNEIYWITRLDGIHTVCNAFVFISIFAVMAFIIGIAVKEVNKEYKKEKGLLRRLLINSIHDMLQLIC